jgi:hypothetical protein
MIPPVAGSIAEGIWPVAKVQNLRKTVDEIQAPF